MELKTHVLKNLAFAMTNCKLHLKKMMHLDAYHHTFFDNHQDELPLKDDSVEVVGHQYVMYYIGC
jgi:hypothetical protein